MPNRKYDGVIVWTDTDCTLHFPSEKFVYRDLRESYPDGAKVTVEIKSRRKPRTLPQNNLFHAYCGIIAEETGNSLEVVKSTLKAMYCKKPLLDSEGEEIINKETGEVLYYIQDTRDMDTVELFDLTENTRVFALDWFGINLPLPGDQEELKFKE